MSFFWLFSFNIEIEACFSETSFPNIHDYFVLANLRIYFKKMFKNLFLPLMVLVFSQKSWELLIVNCELLIVKYHFEDKSEKIVCFQNNKVQEL